MPCRFLDADANSSTTHAIIEYMLQEARFEQQQPPMQAMLQAVMKLLVRRAKTYGLDPGLLQLLPQVPLMHAEDYKDVLKLVAGTGKARLIQCSAVSACYSESFCCSSWLL